MTGTILFRDDTCILTHGDRALFLQMSRDGFATLSEHIAVGYPTPEGPCPVLNDGRCCAYDMRLFRLAEPLGPEEAAAYLRDEWARRWDEDLSSEGLTDGNP